MNNWEKAFGIKYPECKKTGLCCSMATPSTPAMDLLKLAAEGNSYARDFLSIFNPHESIDVVRQKAPEFLEKAHSLAAKSPKFSSPEQVIFFRCRYLKGKNHCQVYEDRPQLCRDYPDTPFLLMPPGCGYEGWSNECKNNYNQMGRELKQLQTLKELLGTVVSFAHLKQKTCQKSLFILSPGASWWR
jgi:Fe-S-cluster containining protein